MLDSGRDITATETALRLAEGALVVTLITLALCFLVTWYMREYGGDE